MKLFYKGKDGGEESTVTGYWLIEWKALFSIVLLKFEGRSREAYHTHAFNCISWVLSGLLYEKFKYGGLSKFHNASWLPFLTLKRDYHKVDSIESVTWVLSFRGPWAKTWQESVNGEDKTLSEHRIEV